jgi:hypothetical protein
MAIQFVDCVLSQLPFAVETIQTDNGAEFQSAFHWHVLDKGINHIYIKSRTPRLNGKVGRSPGIDAEEFYRLLDGVVIDDVKIFNARLKEWQDYDNYDRPHGGLDGQTPYETAPEDTSRVPSVVDHRQPHTDTCRRQRAVRWGWRGCRRCWRRTQSPDFGRYRGCLVTGSPREWSGAVGDRGDADSGWAGFPRCRGRG